MILIDCDGVIVKTVEMFVMLNNRVNNKDDKWQEVQDWDFKPICENLKDREEIDKLFRHEDLYKFPKFYSKARKSISLLDKKYDVAICTVGDNINLSNKMKMFDVFLPNINIITIAKNKKNAMKVGKDLIECDIIIDDHIQNLENSKAKLKILFEGDDKRYKWNNEWDGVVAKSWDNILDLVDNFYNKREECK